MSLLNKWKKKFFHFKEFMSGCCPVFRDSLLLTNSPTHIENGLDLVHVRHHQVGVEDIYLRSVQPRICPRPCSRFQTRQPLATAYFPIVNELLEVRIDVVRYILTDRRLASHGRHFVFSTFNFKDLVNWFSKCHNFT